MRKVSVNYAKNLKMKKINNVYKKSLVSLIRRSSEYKHKNWLYLGLFDVKIEFLLRSTGIYPKHGSHTVRHPHRLTRDKLVICKTPQY